MKMKKWAIWLVACAFMAPFMACSEGTPQAEIRLIDGLNEQAYAHLYRDAKVAKMWADSALIVADNYAIGRAEAHYLLGEVALIGQAYAEAHNQYEQAMACTDDDLETLLANVGKMRIYQRTSQNKEFYECRLKALRLLDKLTSADDEGWSEHRRHRFFVAKCEFYMTSAAYYAYLQQRDKALDNAERVPRGEALQADTNQLLQYNYLKGRIGLCDELSDNEQRLCQFDALYYAWLLSTRKGYNYYIGGSLKGLANLMVNDKERTFFCEQRPNAIQLIYPENDSLIALRLGEKALQLFETYEDTFQQAACCVVIAKYLNRNGAYREAIDYLDRAMALLNDEFNTAVETDIYEQLSVAYAGLGDKAASDSYRNDYLDLLDETRQDKEMESRLQALEAESAWITGMLLIVLLVLLVVVVFFVLFNRQSNIRNKQHLHRLQQLQEICQLITSAIPPHAQSKSEVVAAIEQALKPHLQTIFAEKDWRIEDDALVVDGTMHGEEKALLDAINPYVGWAIENGINSVALGDEQKRLEKQRYIHEQHIAGNKRQNLMKKACMTIVLGIQPYIDRIINEADKLLNKGFIAKADVKREKYEYIDELVTVINEYNDILALWIKMRQGSLHLHIESFALDELFGIMQKSGRAFKMKDLSLEVVPTNAVVKADKALTLFMINTLAENARKYTPEGGMVKIYAEQTDDYVEVSVCDTGCGLSAADVQRITDEKIYDPKNIGLDTASDVAQLKRSKGSGFGLMNCKGIIEKYRKTNAIFGVSCFRVESEPGKGSRFYFRLPKGLKKAFMVALVCIASLLQACTSKPTVEEQPKETWSPQYEALLDMASDYANDAYYANIDGEYEQTLAYVDSALQCLNKHYETYADEPTRYMQFVGTEQPAEFAWWESTYDTDFHIILDIRNEAAVACLALNRLDEYDYNNMVYTSLYKLLGEDQSLESYFSELQRSASQKLACMWVIIVLLLTLPLGYYLLYYRRRQQEQRQLSRLLHIYQTVSLASQTNIVSDDDEVLLSEEDSLKEIPQRTLNQVADLFQRLFGTRQVVVALSNNAHKQLTYSCMDNTPLNADVEALMKQTFEATIPLTNEGWHAYPLVAQVSQRTECIGAIGICFPDEALQPSKRLLLQLLVRYLSIVLYNAVVKLSNQYLHIEEVQEANRRASWEDSQLYVQNQVLDNCLSAIKHETIYYPNRIKQLISRVQNEPLTDAEEVEVVTTISELIAHYKGVYTLLSQCASRQLEEVTFRRSKLAVADIMQSAKQYFDKQKQAEGTNVVLQLLPIAEEVVGDKHQLNFLLENLIDEALSVNESGQLTLKAEVDNGFVRFMFIDHRRNLSEETLNQLFYPDLSRMKQGEHDSLKGTEYLLCKQIIRDHDEFAGRRGCRINAEVHQGGGFMVYFTLPG